MLIGMKHGASDGEIAGVVRAIEKIGCRAEPMSWNQLTAIGLIGNDGRVDPGRLGCLPGATRGSPAGKAA